MGVERLQMLFHICNVSGLLPFRMVLEAQTKRFKRFEGHWRHPNNWWFLILLILQMIFIVFSSFASWSIFFVKLASTSTVILVIFVFLSSSYIIWLLSLRLFLFRFRHLETALKTFHDIDRLLIKIDHVSCHTRRRTIIGITLSLLWVGLLYMLINSGIVFQMYNNFILYFLLR